MKRFSDTLNSFELKENPARFWDILAKIFGGLMLLVTLFWSIWQFHLSKHQDLETFKRAKEKEIELAYWNRKMDVYSRLLEFAGLLSVTPPPYLGNQNYVGFWQTYFGLFQVYLGNDENLRAASDRFAKCVLDAEKIIGDNPGNTNINILAPVQLQQEVKYLAQTVAKSLSEEKQKLSFELSGSSQSH